MAVEKWKTMNLLDCEVCRRRGHSCPATHTDEERRPVCVFCLDGVPCPNAKVKAAPAPPVPAVAPPAKRKNVKTSQPRKEPIMKDRDILAAIRTCKGPGPCRKPIRPSNKSGYCSRHFHLSKKEHPPGAKRGRPSHTNGAGKIELHVSERELLRLLEQLPASERIGILVSEEQLTKFFTGLPVTDRAAIVSNSLAGGR